MPYTLSDSTYAALMRKLAERGGDDVGQPSRGGSGRVACLVRCDSATAAGVGTVRDQCYSATLLTGDAGETEPVEERQVWLTVWGDDGDPVVPVEGRVYLAILSGRVTLSSDDTRQRAFGVPVSSPAPWVHYRATANIDITAPGSTSANFDGQTPAAGDRVLLPQQSTGSQNGPYIWNGSSVPMTRCPEYDTADEITGATIVVLKGSTWAGTIWTCTTAPTITLGSTSLTWTQIYPPATVIPWVHYRATANINISSPGSSSANFDGQTPAVNERVLLPVQGTSSENGVYVYNGASVPMTRAADFDSASEITGREVLILRGTLWAGRFMACTTAPPITLNTTALFWSEHHPDASASARGVVNIDAQTFAGAKTFQDALYVGGAPPTTTLSPVPKLFTYDNFPAVFCSSIYRFSSYVDVANWPNVSYTWINAANITLSQWDGSASRDVILQSYQGGGGGILGYKGLFLSVPQDGILRLYSPTGTPTGYAIGTQVGLTGTSGGGDTVVGGIIVSAGSGPASVAWGVITGTPTTLAGYGITDGVKTSNNLSDLTNAATARTNLGLGTAATRADSYFAQAANNLSDLANAATARTNLGLGSLATASGVNSGAATNITGLLSGNGSTLAAATVIDCGGAS